MGVFQTPKPAIRWLQGPDDAAVMAVKARRVRFPATRGIHVLPLPTVEGRLSWLARDFLTALGKRMSVHATPAGAERLWGFLHAWLKAERIVRVVIVGVDFLNPDLLHRLPELETDTLLIYEGDVIPPPHRDALRALKASRVDRNQANMLLAGLLRPRPRDEMPPPAEPQAEFPAVSTDAFPYFLPRCATALDPASRKAVFEVYLEAQRRTAFFLRKLPQIDHYEVADFLHQLVSGSESTDRELTLLRGAEEAFFRAGWLLRADPDALSSRGAPPPMQITTSQVQRLRWYANPRVAAIAALALTGLTPDGIASLDLDHIRRLDAGPNLEVIGDQRRKLGPLSVFVEAHMIHSHGDCGDQAVPLFRVESGKRIRSSGIRTPLRAVVQETGFQGLDHWTPPPDQRTTHWMRTTGISLQPL
jgi:hypothetical protein